MNAAILLSGSVGSRMHSNVPKQYVSVGGRMLVSYALAALTELLFIDRTLIVAEEGWREAILSGAGTFPFQEVLSGKHGIDAGTSGGH